MEYSFIETSVTCISREMEKVKVVIRSLCRNSAKTLRFYFRSSYGKVNGR